MRAAPAVPARPWLRAYVLVAGLLALLFVASLPLERAVRRALLGESGPVEVVTAIGFLAAALAVLASRQRHRLRHFGALLLLFAARELDFDKRFTAVGILKSRFFFSAEVPPLQKLSGALALLLLAWAVLGILRGFTRPFLAGLARREVASIGALLALVCLVVSKSIDGIDRKLLPLGVHVPPELVLHAGALEEILELGAAAYIALVLLLVLRRRGAAGAG